MGGNKQDNFKKNLLWKPMEEQVVSFSSKILFIYLFLERGGGREKERARSIDV